MVKIVLVGYMGSGKSTIAALVAKMAQIKLLDLDKIIEESEELSISDIFKLKGEIYFRQIESKLFKEIIESNESFVLSTGGGTPCYANNHLLMQNEGVISVYLKTSIEELTRRLMMEKEHRPLLQHYNDDSLKDFIAKHLFDRSYFYHQSKFIVNTGDMNAEEIAERIVSLV
jgi:shikimate kinase